MRSSLLALREATLDRLALLILSSRALREATVRCLHSVLLLRGAVVRHPMRLLDGRRRDCRPRGIVSGVPSA
jgi:hypothetical protein